MSAESFVFDRKSYEIIEAEIYAAINDPYWCDTYNKGNDKDPGWIIHFRTARKQERTNPPSVSFDGLPISIRNWHNLVGFKVQWSTPLNKRTRKRYGMTYVHEHLYITSGSVRIVAREGDLFKVIARGQNEWEQEFSIDAPARFIGIYVRGSQDDNDASIRDRLSRFFDDSNLIGSPFALRDRYDSSVGMGRAFVRPKPDDERI